MAETTNVSGLRSIISAACTIRQSPTPIPEGKSSEFVMLGILMMAK
jgi:hypothetical protein